MNLLHEAKATDVSINIDVEMKWTCPWCKAKNETIMKGDPFKAVATNYMEKECSDCKKMVTVTAILKKELI